MNITLHSDWMIAVLEPASEATKGGIIKVGPDPIRFARCKAVGPGRRYWSQKKSRYYTVPSEVQPGDRFPFFKGASETKQGHALSMLLDDNEVLIRASDVLFVVDEGELEVTL